MSLSNFRDDLTGLLEGAQHLGRLFPPLPNVLTLGEEALYLISLVQAGHQLTLEIVLHEVHHEVHHGLAQRKQ